MIFSICCTFWCFSYIRFLELPHFNTSILCFTVCSVSQFSMHHCSHLTVFCVFLWGKWLVWIISWQLMYICVFCVCTYVFQWWREECCFSSGVCGFGENRCQQLSRSLLSQNRVRHNTHTNNLKKEKKEMCAHLWTFPWVALNGAATWYLWPQNVRDFFSVYSCGEMLFQNQLGRSLCCFVTVSIFRARSIECITSIISPF